MKAAPVWAGATALAFAAVAALAYRTGYTRAEDAFAAQRLEIAKATARQLERRIEAEAQMQEAASERERAYAQRIAALAHDRERLLASLRDRPERPAGGADVPRAAAAAPGAAACTGADLYRDDAQFLVRLAADADQLRAAVGHCQAAYDAVRAQLLQLQAPPRAD